MDIHDQAFLYLLITEELKSRGYEIDTTGLLGKGGMSTVWPARRVADGLPVAVKLFDPSKADLFEAEREALRSLGEHDAIIRLLDSGVASRRRRDAEELSVPYLVLERAERTLMDDLRGGPLPVEVAVPIALWIAEVLDFLHARGFIHQDVKPQNILRIDGRWKLADFSLAMPYRLVGGGTPGRTHPDNAILIKKNPGPRFDLYQLGVLLHEMLTGTLPPAWRFRRPPPPSRSNPAVTPALDAICLGCLDPESTYQYHGARDVVDDLERYLQAGDPPRYAPAVPTLQRIRRYLKDHPRATYFVSGFVVAALTLAAFLSYESVAQARERLAVVSDVRKHASEAKVAIADARDPLNLLIEPLNQFPVVERYDPQVIARVQSGRSQAVLAQSKLQDADRELRRLDASDRITLLLDQELQRLNRACQEVLASYELQDEDREILAILEEVRLSRSDSLVLNRLGFRFDFDAVVERYSRIFREELGIDLLANPFPMEEQVARLARRPAHAKYAVYLTDFMYCWGASLARTLELSRESAFGVLKGLLWFGASYDEENRKIQILRELASRLDDDQPWTRAYYPLFQQIGPRNIIAYARQLMTECDIESVALPKLTILCEAIVEDHAVEGTQFLERLHGIYRDDFWVNHLLAEKYAEFKDPRELHHRHVALNQRPGSPSVRLLVGLAYLRMNASDAALPYLREAGRQNPKLKELVPPKVDLRQIEEDASAVQPRPETPHPAVKPSSPRPPRDRNPTFPRFRRKLLPIWANHRLIWAG